MLTMSPRREVILFPVRHIVPTVAVATIALGSAGCGDDLPTDEAGVPTQLAFLVEPGGSSADDPISPAIRIGVQDVNGNAVSSATLTVTLGIESGTGSSAAKLDGTISQPARDGVATFNDLMIVTAGTGYRLSATASGLTRAVSQPFSIEPGAATRVALTVQPTTTPAGTPVTPPVEAAIEDAYGNRVTNVAALITLALADGTGTPGAAVSGASQSIENGIATFDTITVDKAGSGYRLTASAPDLAGDTSEAFDIVPGDARTVTLTVQPSGTTAGALITPAVEGILRDAHGNTVTAPAQVTVALTPGTGSSGAVLGGTREQTAVNGLVTFDDLWVDKAGTGFTLTVSGTDIEPVTSAPFDIAPWAGTPTSVALESDLGDYIGAGATYDYTQATAVVTASASGAYFEVHVDGDETWNGSFQLPDHLSALEPGTYTDLQRYPFHDPAAGGLSWSGEGRGCNTLTGWIAIDSVTYRSGALAAVSLRFEQHCEDQTPALHGVIHWSADDPTVPPGPTLPIPPELWAPEEGATPASGDYVYLASDDGDYIGQGDTVTYTPTTATIAVTTSSGRNLAISVAGWNGDFEGMTSINRLEPGYYPDLQRYPFHNPAKGGLAWSGQGRGCNRLAGWFAVDEVTYAGDAISTLILRFEQHCEEGVPALRGEIRWSG